MKFILKQKQLKLLLVILSVFALVSPFSFLISAQEAEITATPTPTEVLAEPTASTDPSPTESPLVTPEPTVTAEPTLTQEIAEVTETPTPTPTPETMVETVIDSTSNTGSNEFEGGVAIETDINTGDSLSSGEGENAVDSSSDTGVVTDAEVVADSGDNSVTETKSIVTTISTGDALAYFNLVNFINNEIHDSAVQFYFITLGSADTADEDINQAWMELMAGATPESSSINADDLNVLQTGTDTQVDNQVAVEANTGTNTTSATGGIVIIKTGDAKALANIINLINNNLVSSKYFIGTINIEDGYEGDLILPRVEDFSQYSTIFGSAAAVNENVAVDSQTGSVANSGGNSLTSFLGGEITSGNATSISNDYTEVGGSYSNENSFFLMINNLGNWSGEVLGWSNPGSVDTLTGFVSVLEKLFNVSPSNGEYLAGLNGGADVLLANNVTVSANTGNNSTSGNFYSQIITGDSLAVSNLFNFLNVSFFNSNRFLGIVNILGNWGGKIVFAYPDVAIGIKAVEQSADGNLTLDIYYQNLGIDKARNVVIDLGAPNGSQMANHDSGFGMSEKGGNFVWKLGDLRPGEKGNFRAVIKVGNGVVAEDEKSWWGKIVGQVMAAENDFVIRAEIMTPDPEIDNSNNVANLNIILPNNQGEYVESSEEDRLANLSVSAVNNVGNWVYPTDIVTFEVSVNNLSDVLVKDAVLYHYIFNEEGKILTSSPVKIGLIKPGVKGKVVFGVAIPEYATGGEFKSISYVSGYSNAGSQVFSNEAYTDFLIKTNQIIPAVVNQTKATGDGLVLGEGTFKTASGDSDNLFLPYLVLFLGSSMWLRIRFGGILGQLQGGEAVAVKIKDYLMIGTMMLVFGVTSHQLLSTKSFNNFDSPKLSWQEMLVSGKETNK